MTQFLPDVNVWFALNARGHVHHSDAREWAESVNLPDELVVCRAIQQALLRLLSTTALWQPFPESVQTNAQAWRIWDTMLLDDRIVVASESPGLDALWRQYSTRATASPKLWMDAYLAAFARVGNLRFVTFDTTFNQFDGLDVLVLK